jgi:hypothetical protein
MKILPRFVPVIHVRDDDQAVEQSEVAFANGADGVFLIDHRRTAKKLVESYWRVRQAHPAGWVGLNFLDISPQKAVMLVPSCCDALWFDDPMDLRVDDLPCRENRAWRTFVGVAFKYQVQPEDPAAAAVKAAAIFDVVTTSGPATGMPADPARVRSMKTALGSSPLALASGVSVGNVVRFSGFVDCFMVASSICRSFHELDPAKVHDMATLLAL